MFDWLDGGSGLWALFTTGFLSATLLPGGSEAALVVLLDKAEYSIPTLVAIATLGNTLGGMTNYYLGRLIPEKRRGGRHRQRAVEWLLRYGYGALLFSWLPFIGDPLCLAAGWLRLRQGVCWMVIGIGKCLRYTGLAVVAGGLLDAL